MKGLHDEVSHRAGCAQHCMNIVEEDFYEMKRDLTEAVAELGVTHREFEETWVELGCTQTKLGFA